MLIRIGTSGWTYDDWRGVFYPARLGKTKWLAFYSRSFDTVEVNGTFYRLPRKEAFENWAKQTPSNFCFSIKASRFITHVKRLQDPIEPIKRLFNAAEGLNDKLGPILFQLPPRFPADLTRLEKFLMALPASHRYVFEFRDNNWFMEPVYDLLNAHNAALCIADAPDFPCAEVVTADFVYIRLHGHTILYASEYSEAELCQWAEKLRRWNRDAYVYFDNDVQAHAVKNAKQLRELLPQEILPDIQKEPVLFNEIHQC